MLERSSATVGSMRSRAVLPRASGSPDSSGDPGIKAFNGIYVQHLGEEGLAPGTPGRIALPVAGDDEKAKVVAMTLVDELGFDPVDAGGSDDSWRQQPGTPVYGGDFDADGVRSALEEASPDRTPEWQAVSE